MSANSTRFGCSSLFLHQDALFAMTTTKQNRADTRQVPPRQPEVLLPAIAMFVFCAALCGCAAMTNPVACGIPVSAVPAKLLAEPKQYKEPIPLLYLRQKPPEVYLLAPGDILGVYIEGILGDASQPVPVNIAESANAAPAIGYPMPVQEDGTLRLPLVPPLRVEGMTVLQAEKAIVEAYTVQTEMLQPRRARIIVTLLRSRQTHVQVIRQDSPTGGVRTTPSTRGLVISTRGGAEQIVGGSRHGTGMTVDLPAYENDVLHALAQSGGLPGLDAANEVIIQRGYLNSPEDLAQQIAREKPQGRLSSAITPTMLGGEIIRIPLRLPPGQPPPFRPEDVILHNGDIVFIEARDTEVFYSGGLLPAGEYPLPRDYDLDVVRAISQIGGTLVAGGLSTTNITGTLVQFGLGNPSPRLVSVLRKTPRGGQVTIIVDLNRALQNPCENLLVKPGDVLILQESKGQALARYFSQTFQFSFVSKVINTSATTGTTSVVVP